MLDGLSTDAFGSEGEERKQKDNPISKTREGKSPNYCSTSKKKSHGE